MGRNLKTHPIKYCPHCGSELPFDRSYGFHAGFSNLGFLYNDNGDMVFVWSSFDPDYVALAGRNHPWSLNESEQARIEEQLLPAPQGGRWRFSNPARCLKCRQPVSGPMNQTIYGLLFDGRRWAGDRAVSDPERPFQTILKDRTKG